ncbi:UNVERIFIED_CONTAM: hypothetical protein Sradi_0452700 [Sesamum radiatum]|uniref:RNase H type-1 domain-containing protein n=1 Tax=Sesamum radiatum TaxID=300843 RepID=A0AAW2W7R2_SESRA
MKGYLQEIGELTSQLKSFQLHQIPRTENTKADYLARLASSLVNCNTRNITVRTLVKNPLESNVMVVQVEIDWRKSLLDYLERSILPANEREVNRLKKRAVKFVVLNGTLYKRSISHPFLQCFSREEGKDMLQEIYEGSCESRVGGLALANKTLRVGYFGQPSRKMQSVESEDAYNANIMLHSLHSNRAP